MILDGLELLGSTDAINFSVDSGNELASSGKTGELFFLLGAPDRIGLYVYTGSDWKRIGSTEFKLTPGNGIVYDEVTKTISTNVPVNGTENQILATRNNSLVWVTFTKNDVGLGNVDNTSDANKPISTSTQAALDQKVNRVNPVFEGAISGISKSDIGLGNVDNTSDVNKPVSSATQAALDQKAPLDSPNFTGVVSGISKEMVGLGNVDNTSDVNKPISTATQNALNSKADKANVDSALALKADKSYVDSEIDAVETTLNTKASTTYVNNEITTVKNSVNLKADTSYVNNQLSNVERTTNKNQVNGYVGLNANKKIDPEYLPVMDTGGAVKSVNSKTGDVIINKSDVGLANVDNTSDLNKPISNATQNALNDMLSQSRTGNFTVNSTIIQKVDTSGMSSFSINPAVGNHFKKNINTSGNVVFTFASNPPAGSYTCIIELAITSAGTVGWPTNVYWPNNQAPVLGSGKTHLVMLNTSTSGAIWHGSSLSGFVS